MKMTLPKNWIELNFENLADATDFVSNGSFKSLRENVEQTEIPDYAILVRLKDYNAQWNGNFRYVTKTSFDFLRKSSLKEGDLFIANVGYPGKLFIMPDLGQPMTIGPNGLRIRANKLTSNKFLAYFYSSPIGKERIQNIVAGSAQQKFNKTGFRKTKVYLPPRPEQDRIVAKIDVLMAQVETMQKSLERIPQLLKDFRQQVLTQAVTGKLNLNNGLNDSALMLRTLSIENLVKSLKKDIRTGPFGSTLKKEEHQLDGIPVWGIESIGKEGKFTGKNKIFVTKEKAAKLKSFEVKGGDVIISRSGTVGELCVLPDNIPYGLISTNLMKIVLNKVVIISKFFCWIIKADPGILNRLEELCKGSTRLFLTQTILQKLEFNIPTLKEQQEIVGYVDQLFIKADTIEDQYRGLKTKIDTLPQAILHKAFKGELVEQLPTDGDAKELLKEIEALKKLKVK